MWNSAEDRSNFTVTIYTQNLDCDDERIKLYGQEMPSSTLIIEGLNDDDYLMTATVNVMTLHISSHNEGLNQCVYHQVCDGGCNYFSISIGNGEEEADWKVCEVTII